MSFESPPVFFQCHSSFLQLLSVSSHRFPASPVFYPRRESSYPSQFLPILSSFFQCHPSVYLLLPVSSYPFPASPVFCPRRESSYPSVSSFLSIQVSSSVILASSSFSWCPVLFQSPQRIFLPFSISSSVLLASFKAFQHLPVLSSTFLFSLSFSHCHLTLS